MGRLPVLLLATTVLLILLEGTLGFAPPIVTPPPNKKIPTFLHFSKSSSSSSSSQSPSSSGGAAAVADKDFKTKTLGLLTFDLDDTLYPIAPVLDEANAAFARAMNKMGYEDIEPTDIVETGKQIREEMDPAQAAILSHTEIRSLAIRREMENVIFHRKLQACADDWATSVSSLAPIVVENAKKWAKNSVSDTVVQAVLNAWEMERHHAAERHLYPEVVDVFEQIKKDHPGVIIGAVTDGKANPLFMTFTLAKFFDFSMSWEDDQGGRRQFFQELDAVDGNAELTWIYDAARYKYAVLAQAADGMAASSPDEVPPLTFPDRYDDKVWIHVGDDLAYDVGGSAACGAKTILVELADQYHQTARRRFDERDDDNAEAASWSTTSQKELEKRRIMNEAAKEHVDETIKFLSLLPEAINKILEKEE